MISLKNPGQIAKMRDAGKILREVEDEVRAAIRPGVSTAELDALAEKLIRKNHAIPSSLHYEGYPCSICASINDEVVHGIPSAKRILREGDIVSIDCTLVLDGWQADSAFTSGVGEISEADAKLIRVTEECFWKGVRQCIAGNRLGDVGFTIDSHARKNGFTAIREFTGHGIGREMHEDPAVYNYGDPGRGLRLRRGMTLAVNADVPSPEGAHHFDLISAGQQTRLDVLRPDGAIPCATIQTWLDDFLSRHPESSIDYIHGESSLRTLSEQPQSVGFLLPPIDKNTFFRDVSVLGVLPRKTFSMGEANEKRYYMEARRIQNS